LPDAVSDISALSNLENNLGANFHSCKWYEDWSDSFYPGIASSFKNHGCLPELTWQPQIDGTGVSYEDVISGKYDQYLATFAQSVKSFGSPVRISLAPEMNSEWTAWGLGNNGNNTENHKLFWRYVVNKFRSEGASNVSWIWSANIRYYNDPSAYKDIYPGDDYVDFAGLDGYNWGTTQSWSAWQSFSDVFSRSYYELTSVSNRNILIMEVASTEKGGDKAAWIKSMFSDIQNRFPRIQGFTWFSINKETDWRIDSSPQSLAAFSEMMSEKPPVATGTTTTQSSYNAKTGYAPASDLKNVNKKGSKNYEIQDDETVEQAGVLQVGTASDQEGKISSESAVSSSRVMPKLISYRQLISNPSGTISEVGSANLIIGHLLEKLPFQGASFANFLKTFIFVDLAFLLILFAMTLRSNRPYAFAGKTISFD